MSGRSYDCGNKLGYCQAFVRFALMHSEQGNDFADAMQQELGQLSKVTEQATAE